MAELAFVVLMIRRHVSNNSQDTLKRQGLLLTSPAGYKAHPEPHSEVLGGRKGRMGGGKERLSWRERETDRQRETERDRERDRQRE